jgi:hypothetical protein
MHNDFEDMDENEIIKSMKRAFQEECSAERFLSLAKLLCSKKGMPDEEWEEFIYCLISIKVIIHTWHL